MIRAVVLLGVLAGLAALLLPAGVAAEPCRGAALAVLPIRADFGGYRLEAAGRSAASVPPGGLLCVALAWQVAPGGPAEPPPLRLWLEGAGGAVAARHLGAAAPAAEWQPGAQVNASAPLFVRRTAAQGRYLLRAQVGGADVIDVGVVYVEGMPVRAPRRLDAGTGGLRIQGGLEVWPFVPQPRRLEEGS